MYLSISDVGPDDFFDYCVIGSGPAGLTCALSLAGPRSRILVVEGGDRTMSEASQSIYRGTVIGDPYFDLSTARSRCLGGTSNVWGNWCRRLDDIDFETKTAFPIAAWPIRRLDLEPYAHRAADILEAGPLLDDAAIPDSNFRQVHFSIPRPIVRFSNKYGDFLGESRNIAVSLNTNFMAFATNGDAITGAEVSDYSGQRKTIHANRYILATGGIENSRLLLWSNEVSNGQVVKRAGALGRYWMEHPHFTVGFVILRDSDALGISNGQKFFAISADAIRREGVLNGSLRLHPEHYTGTKKAIADLACVAPEWARAATDLLGKQLVCGATLRSSWEQEPRYENRVSLSTEMDSLRVPRPVLHWRKSDRDRRTVEVLVRKFGDFLAGSDLGRLRLEPWLAEDGRYPDDDELGGYHHLGGTRMAATPDLGVVDRNCRVFGQTNLYVAGSSVFPSGGYANPTFTIVQLALRLADHLKATA